MKAKEILRFMLTGYVSAENCDTIHLEKGQYHCDALGELADDCPSEGGEFFCFWSDNSQYEIDRDKLLSFGTQKNADVELPTKDGYYVLVKIED